jgi:hypothetical protein
MTVLFPTDDDRREVLADYRRWRRTLAPLPAIETTRDVIGCALADSYLAGANGVCDVLVRQYAAATRYLADIEARMDECPYWQTGKATIMPDSPQWEVDAVAMASDEAHSGECWTCGENDIMRGRLVLHIRTTHGREPMNEHDMPSVTA